MIMKKLTYKREAIFWILLLIPFIYIAYIWTQIPDRVPVHFDMHGTPDNWGGKFSIFLLPGVNIGMYLLILFLPKIDPKRMNYDLFNSIFYKMRLAIVFFLCVLSLIITQAAIKGQIDQNISHLIPVAVFLFLAILGNFMINIKPNWFLGVRTPWTLSSDYVWRQTHQVIGRIWFYGGLICAALSFFAGEEWGSRLILTFALGTTAFAFAYSYWLYKKEMEKL